jgi:hypothetical protein
MNRISLCHRHDVECVGPGALRELLNANALQDASQSAVCNGYAGPTGMEEVPSSAGINLEQVDHGYRMACWAVNSTCSP